MLDAYDNDRAAWFDAAPGELDATHDADGARLRCARCGHVLTAADEAVRVGGRGEHVHTNPAGFTFHLRTFARAPGCVAHGTPQREHSWFPPHAWQVACCGRCATHCGWRFSAGPEGLFFALISASLSREGRA